MSHIAQNSQDLDKRVIETLLKQAEQDLSNDDLSNSEKLKRAQSYFTEALAYEGDYSEQLKHIRTLLKSYSDHVIQVTAQTTPDWAAAHEALHLLTELKLDDGQTQIWQREVWRKQALFYLEIEDFAESSKAVTQLMTDEAEQLSEQTNLKIELAALIRSKILQQIDQGAWFAAHQMIENFQLAWPYEDEFANWLTTTAEILDQSQRKIKDLDVEIKVTALELQRSRTITTVLGAIFFIAAIIYIGILFWV